jgi:ribosomal protein L11 methyltransferase
MATNWLEVSLVVDGELAEAVAEVLARYVPNGVAIQSTAIETNLDDEGKAVGPLRVCAYLPIDAETESKQRQIEEALWYLGRIRPIPVPQFQAFEEVNWAETWKQHYQPIPIGKQLIIVPAWLESPDQARIPIRIDPGMAFGTGTHPTTQLCLELLEEYTPDGETVLDIGCGSGILSIAAVKLGAQRAYGVDVDAEAIPAAQANAATNEVASQVEFTVGSVEAIKSGIFPIRQAPLVLANILASILQRLLVAGLGELVAPGGVLVLSGILLEQVPDMETAVHAQGLRIISRKQIDDWAALAVQPQKP